MHFNTTASDRPIGARLNGLVTATGRLSPVLTIPLQLRQLNATDSAQLRLLSVIVETVPPRLSGWEGQFRTAR